MSTSHDTVMLDGFGELYEGSACVGNVQYELSIVWARTAGGTTLITGRIAGAAVDLAEIHRRAPQNLTLYVDEAVRWDCRLTSEQGDLVAAGNGFYRLVEGRRVQI
jgi:hypothetical protein